MPTRLEEFDALVVELHHRYRDLSKPLRCASMLTAAMALAESFCRDHTKRSMTEDEFVSLVRDHYKKMQPNVLAREVYGR